MENHTVTIDNREKTTITDILDIDSFDEEEIRATLKDGAMIIKGASLHIQLLDLAEGRAVISGTVNSLMYVKVKGKGEKGFFAKIIK
ncbi:MAG: YabP/YqfC family sporulation protein [Bacillota bacterium]|nr:YabP/YqfC family sporulation protein [Bacillota bacterium]